MLFFGFWVEELASPVGLGLCGMAPVVNLP